MPFHSVGSLLSTLLALVPPPQQPGAGAPTPAQAPGGDAVRRAFLEAEAGRSAISAAAETVLNGSPEVRTKFLTAIRAIGAVAPKPEPKAPAKADGAPAEAPKPVQFADATKELMATAAGGDADAAKTALATLAADKGEGQAALVRLDERGRAIFARCLVLTIRRKMETNAVYAGQYDELRDFQPEAGELLLRWAAAAPKDVARADEFSLAALRAVRDVVPPEQATDAFKAALREIAAKAQHVRNRPLFVGAACALQQYGDTALFDQMKALVDKQLESDKEEERIGAFSTLADLCYQARQYETAAGHYKTAVELLQKMTPAPEGLATTVYNAACSLSLALKVDESLQYLEKALEIGAKTRSVSKAMIDVDHDLNNLRADPRFAALMEKYFGKAPAAK